MNNVNSNIPVGVSFEYVKLEESIEFFCARCGKRKISKSTHNSKIMEQPRKSVMPAMVIYSLRQKSNDKSIISSTTK